MRRTTQTATSEILVKVGRTGSPVVEVVLNGARTVRDALEAAGVEYESNSRIKVGGETVDLDSGDELENGDIVTVSGSIKGGRV